MDSDGSPGAEIAALGFDTLPFQRVSNDIAHPAGYAVGELGSLESDQAELSQLAAKVLEDPLLLRRLGDRVYELMQADLRNQQERSRGYGGRR